MGMEKQLSVYSLETLQWLMDMDVMAVDASHLLGIVLFEDGTEMEVMLQGTEDGTFLQGVVFGLGNDETVVVTETLDVEGYRVTLKETINEH